MQKWEYMMVIRIRSWTVEKHDNPLAGDWRYWIWSKGAKAIEWKGNNSCDLFCDLGDQGWELVSDAPRSDYLGGGEAVSGMGLALDYAGYTSTESFHFKRPKE
jgi:hypothetical protein